MMVNQIVKVMMEGAAEVWDMLHLHTYIRSHNTLKISQLIAKEMSDGAFQNTEHTCQENVAWKSGGLFKKLGISRESSVLGKEFRGASE